LTFALPLQTSIQRISSSQQKSPETKQGIFDQMPCLKPYCGKKKF